jgi:anti-sigma factor RsiW
MNCRSAESLFSALIEDELSQNERRSLETHLLSCRKCSVSLKETRAAMELFQSLPIEETSPHFEDDVMTRIRSGEGLRPSLIEWVRGILAPPAWLRPVAVAGAGACAVWVVALFVYPNVVPEQGTSPVASVETKEPSVVETPSTVAPDAPAVSVAQRVANPPESGAALASGAVTRERSKPSRASQPRVEDPSMATVASETPVQGFTGGSEIPGPGAGYVDEYITDQFYLDRGNGGSGTPSVTPVSGRLSDDVYIIF